MSDEKPRKYNPIRTRVSCPDCGWIDMNNLWMDTPMNAPFDCPRCKAHYTQDDFFEEHRQKEMGRRHNHAEADLTGEQDE